MNRVSRQQWSRLTKWATRRSLPPLAPATGTAGEQTRRWSSCFCTKQHEPMAAARRSATLHRVSRQQWSRLTKWATRRNLPPPATASEHTRRWSCLCTKQHEPVAAARRIATLNRVSRQQWSRLTKWTTKGSLPPYLPLRVRASRGGSTAPARGNMSQCRQPGTAPHSKECQDSNGRG